MLPQAPIPRLSPQGPPRTLAKPPKAPLRGQAPSGAPAPAQDAQIKAVAMQQAQQQPERYQAPAQKAPMAPARAPAPMAVQQQIPGRAPVPMQQAPVNGNWQRAALARGGFFVSAPNGGPRGVRGAFASRPKNACSRFFCRCASRVSLYFCPRRLLQGLQAGTRLSIVSLPPASCSMRWSASVAGCPHQWQSGLCASSWRLAAMYWGVRCLLAMSGFLLCVECSCLPPAGAPPRGGLPS